MVVIEKNVDNFSKDVKVGNANLDCLWVETVGLIDSFPVALVNIKRMGPVVTFVLLTHRPRKDPIPSTILGIIR